MTRQEAMKNVQMYEFAIMDTALFLDTHPTNELALTFYNEVREMYMEAVSDYEEQFGPLTNQDIDTQKGWSWIHSPWPWEVE